MAFWRALLCRIRGHRWFVERDLTKPPARCVRCGARGDFKTEQ